MSRSVILKAAAWSVAAWAAAISLHVWIKHAPRYFRAESPAAAAHTSHLSGLLVHIVFASPALLLGPFALWSGLRRRFPVAHRWAGRVYISSGAVGIGAGVWLAASTSHRPTPNFNVALIVLAAAWFGATAMAWRAIRNKRAESHREWMIRSYVLTWSFVVCRLPEYSFVSPLLSALGPDGDTTVLWIGWVLPLLMIQIWLEWRRGSAAQSSAPVFVVQTSAKPHWRSNSSGDSL